MTTIDRTVMDEVEQRGLADAEFLERTLGDEVSNALAVLITDRKIRGYLETHDPAALAQARDALGLPKDGSDGDG